MRRTEPLSTERCTREDGHTQREEQRAGRESASKHLDKRRKEKGKSSGKRKGEGEKSPGQQEVLQVEQLRLPEVFPSLEQPGTAISSAGGK